MSILSSIGKAISSVASPLVSGAFGIGSSLLNNSAQSSANKTNMQIAQMNNQWSEKMMEKQNMYNTEQWNREKQFALEQREYDSPSNQVQRLKEAGLNPALSMGQGQTGSAASTPSGSSVGLPSPSSTQVQPLSYDGFASAINNTVQMSMALSRNNAEVDAINQTQNRELALARAKIAEMYENTRSVKFKNELNDITKDLQVQHMNEDYLRKVQERSNMEEQSKLIKQQVIANQLITGNLPEKLSMEIAVMASQRDLNKHNAKSQIEQMIDLMEKRGYKLSKSDKKRIFDALIQDIETQQYRGLSPFNAAIGILNRE